MGLPPVSRTVSFLARFPLALARRSRSFHSGTFVALGACEVDSGTPFVRGKLLEIASLLLRGSVRHCLGIFDNSTSYLRGQLGFAVFSVIPGS